jgi:hypothetical protein
MSMLTTIVVTVVVTVIVKELAKAAIGWLKKSTIKKALMAHVAIWERISRMPAADLAPSRAGVSPHAGPLG